MPDVTRMAPWRVSEPARAPSAALTIRVCQALAERAARQRQAAWRKAEASRRRQAAVTAALRDSGALSLRLVAIARDREAGS